MTLKNAPATELVRAGALALTLHWRDGTLARVRLRFARPNDAPGPGTEHGRRVQAALEAYAAGSAQGWPGLPLAWGQVSGFARRVLTALREQVPFGRTQTYGGLAALAGRPRAARAVGRVLANKPWPLLVPCHRVLGADGRLTGFSSADGLEMKRFLLTLEGSL